MEKCILTKWKLILAASIVLMASLFLFAFPALASEPVITKQPENIAVNYPNGGTFSVEVANPEDVTYQWYFIDGIGQSFMLDGTSATTNTLVMPSTEYSFHGCNVFCKITDKSGEYTVSNFATITINNYLDEIPVLYLESYALLPGENINLTEANLGSGKISFSSKGDKIIFDNVNFSNDTVVFDHIVSPAIGLMYRGYKNDFDTLTLELVGKNTFTNTFYQESSNGSGIPIDFYCLGENTKPVELLITGDGTLALNGGTYLIRNNGKITVDADLTFREMNGHFCDGIHASNTNYATDVTICPGVKIDAKINGCAIFSSSKINIQKDSILNIYSSAPFVGAGDTSKNVIYSRTIDIAGATLNIDMMSEPDRFLPYHSAVGMFTAINSDKLGGINIVDSDIKIHITDKKSGTPFYTFNNGGIIAGNDSNLFIKNSNIAIDIDCEDAINAEAIRVAGQVDIIDSKVKVNVNSLGLVYGIFCRDAMNLENSNVDTYVDASDYGDEKIVEGIAHGIISSNSINVTLKDNQSIKAVSKRGISFGVDYSTGEKEAAGYDEAYIPKYITLGENCEIIAPENAVLNRTSRTSNNAGTRYIYTETPYNSKNTLALEDTTLIQAKKSVPETADTSSSLWLILLASAFLTIVIAGIKIFQKNS